MLKSKAITLNGADVTVNSDGSITRTSRGNRWRTTGEFTTFGHTRHDGYKAVSILGHPIYVHRIIASTFIGDCEGLEVHHLDSDKSNNRVENLEVLSKRDHQEKTSLGSSSQFLGVSYKKDIDKWESYVKINSRKEHIGLFDSELDAAIARDSFLLASGASLDRLNMPENHENIPTITNKTNHE